ncbi:MAG: HAMP domain-containing sensor histidine kinase [Limnochordia bacterium]
MVPLRWGIRSKIVALFVLIALLSTGLALVASMALTRTFFNDYVHRRRILRAEQLAVELEDYYRQNGESWHGVEGLFSQPRRGMMGRGMGGERLILADAHDRIIFDTQGGRERLPSRLPGRGAPITLRGHRVGTVFVAPGIVGANMEEEFLTSLGKNVLRAGFATVVMAIIIGYFLSQRLVKPLESLALGAQRIAHRDLDYRVDIDADDEIGDLARSFNTMAAQLEEADRLRKNMIADLAHELRTPITILRGNLESLQWNLLQPTPELIISLHDEAVRVSRLLTDLQSLAVAEGGGLRLNYQQVDLAKLVEGIQTIIFREAEAKEVELVTVIPPDLPSLKADPDRLRQILLNLLTNALEHTPAQGCITLTAQVQGAQLGIGVQDTGPGIPAAEIPRVFHRYYRGSSRGEGIGLGLAIARAYVEAHGGRIEVSSIPRRGTTFTCWFPLEEG